MNNLQKNDNENIVFKELLNKLTSQEKFALIVHIQKSNDIDYNVNENIVFKQLLNKLTIYEKFAIIAQMFKN